MLWLLLLLCVHFFSAVCIVVVAEFTLVFFFSFLAHSFPSVVYPSAYNSSSHEQYRHRGNFLSFLLLFSKETWFFFLSCTKHSFLFLFPWLFLKNLEISLSHTHTHFELLVELSLSITSGVFLGFSRFAAV